MDVKRKFNGTKKTCIGCLQELPLSDFYQAKSTGVYFSRCKKCDIAENQRRSSTSYKNRASVICNAARSNSKKRNLPFTITRNDVIRQYEIQKGKCYYSGRPMSWVVRDNNIMSIDRKNPACGYTPDNIVLCCWVVNSMKNNMPPEEFLGLCKDICRFSLESNA